MPIFVPGEKKDTKIEMRPVRQNFEAQFIDDIETAVANELKKPEIAKKIKPGMRIAIAAGSRGINGIDRIVKKTAQILIAAGTYPFVTAAMGSHGGGTEEGQKEILTEYGITEKNLGIPVLTQMDVVKLGKTSFGNTVYLDKAAHGADMTILVNRVKVHTDFDGQGSFESGLCKMAAIGLGNHIGCSSLHKAKAVDFPAVLAEAAALIFDKANIGFGIAVVENAHAQPYIIEAIPVDMLPKREGELLNVAKEKMAKLRFPEIDILVIEEIGKDISGCGADPNVIGRLGPKKDNPDIPKIKCVIVLGISKKSHGNATGIGMADLTTKKAFEVIDFEKTYTNCLIGGSSFGLDCARIPPILENEEEAMAAALKICGAETAKTCRVVRIKNTKELERISVSEALWPYVKSNTHLFCREDAFC